MTRATPKIRIPILAPSPAPPVIFESSTDVFGLNTGASVAISLSPSSPEPDMSSGLLPEGGTRPFEPLAGLQVTFSCPPPLLLYAHGARRAVSPLPLSDGRRGVSALAPDARDERLPDGHPPRDAGRLRDGGAPPAHGVRLPYDDAPLPLWTWLPPLNMVEFACGPRD